MTCLQCLEVQQNPTLVLEQVKPCMLCSCTVSMCSSPRGKIKCVLAVFAFEIHSMWQWCGRENLFWSLSSTTMASAASFPKMAWHHQQGLWEKSAIQRTRLFPWLTPPRTARGISVMWEEMQVWKRAMESKLSCSPASPSFPPCKLAVPSLLKAWSQGILALPAAASSVATPHWQAAAGNSCSGEFLVRFKD